MTKARRVLVPVATCVLIAAIIAHSWFAPRQISKSIAVAPAQRIHALEERLFRVQVKLLIGAREYIDRLSGDPMLGARAAGGFDDVYENVMKEIFSQRIEERSTSSETKRYVKRERAIFAFYNGRREFYEPILQELTENQERSPVEARIDSILKRVISGENGVLTSEEQALAEDHLGFFAKLLFLKSAGDEGARRQYEKEVNEPALSAFRRFLKFLLAAAVVATISIVSFVFFFIRFLSRGVRSSFTAGSLPPYLALEIFFLYLCGMYAAPYVLEVMTERGIPISPLTMNCLIIAGLTLTLAWPLFQGFRFGGVRQTLGLETRGAGKLMSDVMLAPFFYLGSWVVLLIILLIYSLIISQLGIDVSQGAHPIVPFLAASNDPRTKIIVFVLAVIIAPFVEEIMFRGAFYAWLRSKLKAPLAILISAVVFASVHPQGAIGLVPLSAIGAVLAFLREWRGTLVAPMLVHACFNGGTLLLVMTLFG